MTAWHQWKGNRVVITRELGIIFPLELSGLRWYDYNGEDLVMFNAEQNGVNLRQLHSLTFVYKAYRETHFHLIFFWGRENNQSSSVTLSGLTNGESSWREQRHAAENGWIIFNWSWCLFNNIIDTHTWNFDPKLRLKLLQKKMTQACAIPL